MTKAFTILAFPKANQSVGSSRYRFWYLAEEWKRAGAQVTAYGEAEIQKKTWTALRQEIARADVVYLQRPMYSRRAFLKLITALYATRTRVIFDYDDAVYHNAFLKWLLCLYRADAVVAGSSLLAEQAQKIFRHAVRIPTTIPGDVYFEGSVSAHGGPTLHIGWVGNGPSHVENLALLVEPFRLLQSRGIDFSFELVGSLHDPRIGALFAFLGDRYHEVPSLCWSDPRELIHVMRGWDVGVMPLTDTEWNRGKCAFKAIEYMAIGLPAVVSAVGENVKLVEGALSWLAVTTSDEWADALIRLMDAKIRAHVGNQCRDRIMRGYTTESVAPQYLTLFGFDQDAFNL